MGENEKQKTNGWSRKVVAASYDAAQTTADNAKHWMWADSRSADAAADPNVRKTLRNRARYEYANNPYCSGMAQTVAGDTIGTGPVLCCQVENPSLRKFIEAAWCEWADEIALAEKLRTMRIAKLVDGEAFALLVQKNSTRSNVALDLIPFESDRVTSSKFDFERKLYVDGIKLDKFGYPVSYDVLDQHPGDTLASFFDYTTYPAENVLHWFRIDRPEQHRGVTELAPALPLFAQMRRYTLAVLAAAETAADFAMVLYTDSPEITPEEFTEAGSFPLERNMLNMLPPGWKSSQLDPKQPTNTYPDFKRELLSEIGRVSNVPVNVLSGDSSRHNYASGRLDHQTYYRAIRIEQQSCAAKVLNPVFRRWYQEFRLYCNVYGQNGQFGELPEKIPFNWIFDGFEHVDPSKEADAQEKRLANHTTTLAYEFAKLGKDWEEELVQMAKEKKMMEDLGLVNEQVKVAQNESQKNDEDDEDDSV